MDTFLGSLLFYVIKFIALAAVAVAGACIGAGLRKRKDAKAAAESNNRED